MMYVGTFSITSDRQSVLMRVDIEPAEHVGSYSLTDPLGDCHEWSWSLRDFESESFEDLARVAIVVYLSHLTKCEWDGSCTVVHSALGLEGLDKLVQHCLFLHSTYKPDEVALQ